MPSRRVRGALQSYEEEEEEDEDRRDEVPPGSMMRRRMPHCICQHASTTYCHVTLQCRMDHAFRTCMMRQDSPDSSAITCICICCLWPPTEPERGAGHAAGGLPGVFVGGG